MAQKEKLYESISKNMAKRKKWTENYKIKELRYI